MRVALPKGVRQFYIECFNTHTNAELSKILDDRDRLTGKRCRDGKRRNLWLVSEDILHLVLNSAHSAGFKVKVFFDQSDGGSIFQHHWTRQTTAAANSVAKHVQQMLAARHQSPAASK